MFHDLRYAIRMLLKAPGFTMAAMLTLALGIGANSTVFSLINATVLRRLPFPEPRRLVLVGKSYPDEPFSIVSAPTFWDWRQQNHVFAHMAAFDSAGKGYSLGATPGRDSQLVSGVRVSADFFNVLGVQPMLGRGFLPDEELLGNDHVAVLSYGLWQRHYGGDRRLIGSAIKLDGEDYTIIGVMPRDFEFQFWSDPRELWVPAGWTESDHSRGANSFVTIARLKPGVTGEQATSEMRAIQARLAQEYPPELQSSASVLPMSTFGLQEAERLTMTLLAAVGFVLLIGCVNVANLMLARAAERHKEFAIRRALGATNWRVLRQLLAESLMLAFAGGAAGLFIAMWATQLLTRILPPGISFLPFRSLGAVHLDARVLAFTLVISCLTGVLFGLAPGLSAVRFDVNKPLKEGGRTSHSGHNRFRYALVASEVGLTLVVLSAAGLMIKSMARLVAVDPGFDPKNVLTLEVSTPQPNIYAGPPAHPRFCQLIDEQIGSIAGVEAASAAAHLPMRGDAGRTFFIAGRGLPPQGQEPSANYTVACPNYFRTLGIPVLSGREFTHRDSMASPGVVIINQALAQKYFPDQDPIGQRISLDARDATEPWLTVVGMVRNVRHWGLDVKPQPQFFRPFTQAGWPSMQIVVKTATPPALFAATAKDALAKIEPSSTPSLERTMEQTVWGSLGSRRFPMLLLATFAGLALVLAAIGVAGVVSHSVTQRTHELGVRIALGAQARDILALVLRGSLRWTMLGVVVGGVGSLVAAQLLAKLLYDVKPNDPGVLAIVACVIVGVALCASYAPARRATRVDPIIALRNE
jgi:putative ABC transport system permease protein